MAQYRKYGFDTEFAPDGEILHDGAAIARRLSPEEIEAACAAAYEKGKKDAIAQAEREAASALQALAGAASAVLTRLDAESRAMREEAARVAVLAARKIAGAALDRFSADHIEAAVDAAMDSLRHQPRLVVRLAPEAAEGLRPRIETMTQTHAYAGAVLVREQAGLRAGEVIIDWSDGVIAIDPENIAQRINDVVDAALASAEAHA
ncbi:MAG: hypothetical protein AB7G40_15865 [Hyphomonadaceae bacterium]